MIDAQSAKEISLINSNINYDNEIKMIDKYIRTACEQGLRKIEVSINKGVDFSALTSYLGELGYVVFPRLINQTKKGMDISW